MEDAVRQITLGMMYMFYVNLAEYCYGYNFACLIRVRAAKHLYGI